MTLVIFWKISHADWYLLYIRELFPFNIPNILITGPSPLVLSQICEIANTVLLFLTNTSLPGVFVQTIELITPFDKACSTYSKQTSFV